MSVGFFKFVMKSTPLHTPLMLSSSDHCIGLSVRHGRIIGMFSAVSSRECSLYRASPLMFLALG